MANSRWPPVGRRFAGARSQFASAAAAQSQEETSLGAAGARSRRVERDGHVPSGFVAVTGHQGDPEPELRALRPRACCQNESEVDAGRAESGLESGVLLVARVGRLAWPPAGSSHGHMEKVPRFPTRHLWAFSDGRRHMGAGT